MLKLKNSDITWSLPMMFGFDVYAFSLIDTLNKYNIEYNFEIYGSPICEWNDGIFDFIYSNDIKFVERTLDNFKIKNVTPTLSFNKYNVKNFNDEFCNNILQLASEINCNIVVSNEKLFKHIKKRYPNIFCIASSAGAIMKFGGDISREKHNFQKELDYYNNLIKMYDRVILRPDFVKTEFMKGISDLSKVEIIVNYPCIKNCPKVKSHYEFLSEQSNSTTQEFICYKDYKNFDNINPDLFLDFEEIEKLTKAGVRHFRILPDISGQNNILLMYIISYVFKESVQQPCLFEHIIKNFEASKFFYTDEIIRNVVIQNLQNKRLG